MKRHLYLSNILPGIVLGVALLLAQGATNAAHADWNAYFIKSSSSSCSDFYAEMDAAHGTGFSGIVYADVLATGIADGDYQDRESFGGIQWVNVDAADDRSSFTWTDVTDVLNPEPDVVGINMVCIKAGNGRTCWKTDFDKDISPIQVFTDLNTTSKIGNAWFCSDSDTVIANGGPDCPYSGETLNDLFSVTGNQVALTFYDGASSQTCVPPGSNFRQCGDANSYAPIGTGEGQCDPTDSSQNCCRIDNACAETLTTIEQIIENCSLEVGGPTTSTGYSKGGDNTCIFYGPSGDGSSVQICF